ncbi:MAG: PhoH family protein [Planctomycetes bacterium]|nr:PhoH family protein [Planctomycetota bacterium]
MSQATISFADPEQIRFLFGAQDEYLRRLRDSIGVEVVLRGDELRLHGSQAQIELGRQVVEELRTIIEKKGFLHESEFQRVLGDATAAAAVEPAADEAIDLFEKAKTVRPVTRGQGQYVRAIRENSLVFCIGPAGSGKTFLAVAMALNALRQEQVRKIVLVRPAVEAGEKLGYLPGDIFAKVNPYLRPLLDALSDLLNYEQVRRYMDNDVIEIVPLAFMRGRTLNNTFMILDEGQNTTVTQMKMFLTRMGVDSKIVVTGDVTQVDLAAHVQCGLTDAISRLSSVRDVAVVRLQKADIVRHPLVGEIVEAYERKLPEKKSRNRR